MAKKEENKEEQYLHEVLFNFLSNRATARQSREAKLSKTHPARQIGKKKKAKGRKPEETKGQLKDEQTDMETRQYVIPSTSSNG